MGNALQVENGRAKTSKWCARRSSSAPRPPASAPELGEHTEEVLLEHGYTWDDIAALKEKGAIG